MTGKTAVEVTREWFAEALRAMSDEEFPDDASLVGIQYKAGWDTYELVFESDEIEEVQEGETVQIWQDRDDNA